MSSPYQCLQKCGGILFAATSSCVHSFSIDDGSLLSSWTSSTSMEELSLPKPESFHRNGFEPPTKKRKLSESHIVVEDTTDHATGHDTEHIKFDEQESPAVIALAATSRGDHVIVATGEDKAIRVFEHSGRGYLRPISLRVMPKRPCTIAITADDSKVICADKFGDVYSIPLLFSTSSAVSEKQKEYEEITDPLPKLTKPFVPAANDLTVHSARNRKALQNQMKQKENITQKFEPKFERKLLLGHVSMLTDVVLSNYDGKDYIITADRDEHIRISRGLPQAHIIESYCLGHKEFISRLCLPASQPNLLISGGGDDDIYVWDWTVGKVLHKTNLRYHVERAAIKAGQDAPTSSGVDKSDAASPEPVKIAVSGIEYVGQGLDQQFDLIMVICEGIPAVFMFALSIDAGLSHHQSLVLEGNPLDLIVIDGLMSMIVSVDNAHESGSTQRLRTDQDCTVQPLQIWQKVGSEWFDSLIQFDIPSGVARRGNGRSRNGCGNLSDLLYPIERLRKALSED